MQGGPGGDTAVDGQSDAPAPDADRRITWLVALSVVAAIAPIVVATVRAIARGWIPPSDDAIFALRAHDVFTHNTPLLGPVSSVSLDAGRVVNHPGPLFFDALAIPERLFGLASGAAIGTALVNCLAVIGIALVARRRGGPVLVVMSMGAAAILGWAMGSEILFEPWQPHILILPFLCLIVLVWSLSCGDLALLPWVVLVASFLVETHLSYVVLVPVLALWGLVGLGLELRRRRRDEPDAWPALRKRTWRTVGIAAGVLFLCWLQPLIEQVSATRGNFTRLLDSAQTTQNSVFGWGLATRLVATVLSLPPFWFRPGFSDDFLGSQGWTPPSLLVSLLSLAALALVLGACFWIAHQAADRISARAIITTVVAIGAGVVTAERNPVGTIGIAPHVLRWLWPIAAFATFAIAATLVRRWHRLGRKTPAVIGAFAFVAVLFGALNLPSANLSGGPNASEYAIPAIKGMERRLGVLDGKGPFLIDGLLDEIFDPYGPSLIPELDRRGFAFVAKDPLLSRQLGPNREYTGKNARTALFVRSGVAARQPLPGTKRVASFDDLSPAKHRALKRLVAELMPYIDDHGLQLNAAGQRARADGRLPFLDAQTKAGALDAKSLLASGEVAIMVNSRYLVIDPSWKSRFERYATLEVEWNRLTVAMFARPVTPADRHKVRASGTLPRRAVSAG